MNIYLISELECHINRLLKELKMNKQEKELTTLKYYEDLLIKTQIKIRVLEITPKSSDSTAFLVALVALVMAFFSVYFEVVPDVIFLLDKDSAVKQPYGEDATDLVNYFLWVMIIILPLSIFRLEQDRWRIKKLERLYKLESYLNIYLIQLK